LASFWAAGPGMPLAPAWATTVTWWLPPFVNPWNVQFVTDDPTVFTRSSPTGRVTRITYRSKTGSPGLLGGSHSTARRPGPGDSSSDRGADGASALNSNERTSEVPITAFSLSSASTRQYQMSLL